MTDAPRGPTTEELRARALGPQAVPVTGPLAQMFGAVSGPSRFGAAIFVNVVRLLVAEGETPDSLEWLLAETLADLDRHSAPLDTEKGERLGSPSVTNDSQATRDPGR